MICSVSKKNPLDMYCVYLNVVNVEFVQSRANCQDRYFKINV